MPEVILPCPNPKCVEKLCRLAMDDNCYHFVECPTCGYHGPESLNSLSAIAAHNALPRALPWTNETPKVAGWYWVRQQGENFDLIQHYNQADIDAGFDNERQLKQWAGPIAPPVD